MLAGFATRDGKLWISEGSQALVGEGDALVSRTLQRVPATAGVRAIVEGEDGVMWIGTTAGLVRIKDGKEQLIRAAQGLADDFVYSLTLGANGVVVGGDAQRVQPRAGWRGGGWEWRLVDR